MKYESEIGSIMMNRKEQLRKVMQICQKELASAPDGTLYACPRQNCDTYRYYLKEEDAHGTGHFGEIYLDKSKSDLKKKLAEKKYYSQLLKASECEFKKIDRFLKGYDGDSLINTYKKLNNGFKCLIRPIMTDDEHFIEEWESRSYTGLPFEENDMTEFYSNRGERMRSKSEVLIANTLDKMSVLYKYEAPLVLKNGAVVHPDFTLLNVRKRKELYWEHLGKMDDANYIASNIMKFTEYKRSGIIPGINMIITFETRLSQLGTKEIETMIRAFLI